MSRISLLVIAFLGSIWVSRDALSRVWTLAMTDDRYLYILTIPLISAGLIFLRRSAIFRDTRPSPAAGVLLVLLAGALQILPAEGLNEGAWLWQRTIGFALLLWAILAGLFGWRTVVAGLFPLGLLFLLAPLPAGAMHAAEIALQKSSAEATGFLFRLAGTPAFQEGTTFSLPGVVIEVAEECSGIRAATGILLATAILANLFLHATWQRAIAILVAIPILIFKNAVRIASISWLGVYVSPGYFDGPLHRSGGPIFALVAVALLVPVFLILRRFRCAN